MPPFAMLKTALTKHHIICYECNCFGGWILVQKTQQILKALKLYSLKVFKQVSPPWSTLSPSPAAFLCCHVNQLLSLVIKQCSHLKVFHFWWSLPSTFPLFAVIVLSMANISWTCLQWLWERKLTTAFQKVFHDKVLCLALPWTYQ